jgi:ribosomal protein S18 acetylase RimI-like enzyme
MEPVSDSIVVTLDPREPALAQELLGLQRASYAVEAALIGFDAIPPLQEPVEALMAAPLAWLGVRQEGRLAAAVAYARLDDDRVVDIDRLVVAPWAFRRGYGRALVGAVIQREVTARRFLVSTGSRNTPARRLYEALGFQAVRERPIAPGIFVTQYELRRESGADQPTSQRRQYEGG